MKHSILFLFLLPVFFVFHGFMENYDYIPVSGAIKLTLIYWLAAIIISFLGWLIFRSMLKAALLAFFILVFHLFFGSFHDGIKNYLPGSIFSKYSFLLPFFGIVFLMLIIWLKKSKSYFYKTGLYLNVLLVLLLTIDIVRFIPKAGSPKKISAELPNGYINCDTCSKPDIYFILADEYAGASELKDQFNFDNTGFIDSLSKRGFHTISETHSNYNYTPFSVASILNMNYLHLRDRQRGEADLSSTYLDINNNQLLQFLRSQGYEFYNYSIFDFEGQPARVRENFLPAKTRFITSQTFLSRFDRDLRFNFITRFRTESEVKKLTYYHNENNKHIYALTWDIAEKKPGKPKFIYSHLMMPHYPYYYNKSGEPQPYERVKNESNQTFKPDYIEYLQYCNNQLLKLVDHIQKASTIPPVIIIMGDHGFRHFTEPVEKKYHFLNHVSLHVPGGNYDQFRDSLGMVNFFRAYLNTSFNQNLPFLKDSTIFLRD